MPPTMKDFQAFQRKSSQEDRTINLELLKVAAVKATDLTGHPGWDRLLEQLQAMLNDAEREVGHWTDVCVTTYRDEDSRQAQCQVAAAKAQVALLRRIMGLPHDIMREWEDTAIRASARGIRLPQVPAATTP